MPKFFDLYDVKLLPVRISTAIFVMEDSHRLFLQAFMTHYVMYTKEVKEHFAMALKRFGGDYELGSFVITINENIKPLNLEIRKGISEKTGNHCYCLVNASENHGILKQSSDYTVNELEYFKKLVGEIAKSPEGSISSVDALNQVDKLENVKMSKKMAQDLIDRFQKDLWIISDVNEGHISLDTRCILELGHYLKDTYEDFIVNCEMCKQICLQGQSCGSCRAKLHHHCAARCFRNRDSPKCPASGCGAPWPYEQPERVEPSQQPTQNQGRKRRR
ncbi:non-structural maintenance of chromosomes element 1 homolog isoform X2 [Lingula anatina]|uniref:Non-structural maintenance of chromosomes element 1 homolog n=1 Tax=Lingula anatina TaxID=7574 RepID=A0A1S3JS79_LINAN|nr:non-structural maintenance of chromosomes element 1 homolog isoform X2 [Lingula anatina]|eukprot:XP_013413243.1 non-structural maintenance of chromosomes element 1 homolog isoform X2 [Lingula anatina]